MASENPEVVVAPTVENVGAESSSRGKDEPLETALSKKLEVTEDGKEENEGEEEEGSKGE